MTSRLLRACGLLVGSACQSAPPPAPQWLPAGLVPFLGVHQGDLHMHGAGGVQSVPMRLEVTLLDGEVGRLRWVLQYGEGNAAQVRDYRLVVDDGPAGRCHIDEQNGIELHARLIDGELVSIFTVPGQTLCARYRAGIDGIEFGLEAFVPPQATATGQDVRSVGTFALHRARLLRVPRS